MNRNKIKRVLITGCCGFIGSHLTQFLIKKKFKVIGLDNLSTGKKKFINQFNKKYFKFYKIDLLKQNLDYYFKNIDMVFHLSANADVRNGLNNRKKDLEQNIIVTHKILEQLVKNKIKKFAFSSSGSVYGDTKQIPTNEDCPLPIQTSLYGASKISAEAFIEAYAEAYNINSYIFRFVSILGPRYSHGHVFDFTRQLLKNPKILYVLGDGNQRKSYLHVKDCIKAIWLSINKFKKKINRVNLGTNEYFTVKASIKTICNRLDLKPKLIFKGGKRGWIGDNPLILLDIKKIKKTGWKPKLTIKQSVEDTVDYLVKNQWILKKN